MSVEVKIPAVGESISSGVVSVWHKKSGDFVDAGEALFTLETDKVSTEIVAEKSGVLEAKAAEGQEVKIGEVVATIDDSKSAPEEKKVEKRLEKKKQPDAEKKRVEEKERKASPEKERPLAPAVRRIVEEEHLEAGKISGTGKDGRLTKGDALAAAQDQKSVGEAVSFPPSATEDRQGQPETDRFIRRKMSPFRRKIAPQLVMAQQTAAILTTFNECDMSAVQELRAKSQESFTKKKGIKLVLSAFL